MEMLTRNRGIAILLLLVAVGLFANLLVYWVLPTAKAQFPTEPGRVNVIPLMNANAAAGCARPGDNNCSLFVVIDPGRVIFKSGSGIYFCYMAVPGGSSYNDSLEVRCAPDTRLVGYSR
jgi:hypothetical protein